MVNLYVSISIPAFYSASANWEGERKFFIRTNLLEILGNSCCVVQIIFTANAAIGPTFAGLDLFELGSNSKAINTIKLNVGLYFAGLNF